MFPKLWTVNWPDKLIAFSEKFPDYMKETKHIQGKRMEKVNLPIGIYNVVSVIAPPVLPIVSYSDEEINLYLPM